MLVDGCLVKALGIVSVINDTIIGAWVEVICLS
jgi:hypothetical protein